MNRDMDLVRQILLVIEDHEHGHAPTKLDLPGYTEEAVGYHLVLMGEAGLLIVTETTCFGDPSPQAIVIRMTWAGHEFVGNARNETVWNRVKNVVAAKGGSVSFEVMKFLILETAKSYFLQSSLRCCLRNLSSRDCRRLRPQEHHAPRLRSLGVRRRQKSILVTGRFSLSPTCRPAAIGSRQPERSPTCSTD